MNSFIGMFIREKVKDIIDVIKMILGYLENKNYYKSFVNDKTIYLFDVPMHGNLGDQAIAMGENKFFEKYYPEYKIIEITTKESSKHILSVKKFIKKDDLVFLHGGGNFGTEYLNAERARRLVIKNIRYNKIIMFPQTMDFKSDSWGEYQLAKSKKIYNSNPNLLLVAREQKSYDLMKSSFLNQIIKIPDIAFILDEIDSTFARKYGTVCLRSDVESTLALQQKEQIQKEITKMTSNIFLTDTVISRRVTLETREKELEIKWKEFKKSQFVVTDRLHGLIFCIITGTPCVVLQNYNHKVIGTYDWVNNLKSIYLLEDLKEVACAVEHVLLYKNETGQKVLSDLREYYDIYYETIETFV